LQYGKVPGIDKRVSRLVQGTVMVNARDQEKSFALLDAVFDEGCTTFDTAHVYGSGDCERTLGKWVGERGLRDKVVIITKGAHPMEGRVRVTPSDITSDLHESLGRLQMDYIDLYLLHRDDESVPVGPLVEVLNEHRKAGKIHAFGGSNWSHERIRQANEYADSHGLVAFAATSPNFSLAEQVKAPWEGCLTIGGPEAGAARAWYEAQGIAVFAWSSLGGGFFSCRFTRDNLDMFASRADRMCVECYCTEENFQRLDRCLEFAAERGLTVAQVALAWVLGQPLNVFALVGCASGEQCRENARALEVRLTDAELAWLDLRNNSREEER